MSSDPEPRDTAIGRLPTLFAAVPVGVDRLANKMCATGWENRERRLDVVSRVWLCCIIAWEVSCRIQESNIVLGSGLTDCLDGVTVTVISYSKVN